MLTPASFIVVNSINGANYLSKEKSYSALASALTQSVAPVIASPIALISEITKRVDSKPIQLRCRVIMGSLPTLNLLQSNFLFILCLILVFFLNSLVCYKCSVIFDRLLPFMSSFLRTQNP